VKDLAIEGKVVAVAADWTHRFSKPLRDHIMLIPGHGVEGDAHAGAFVRHRCLAHKQPNSSRLSGNRASRLERET
jgi:hypothetical protein